MADAREGPGSTGIDLESIAAGFSRKALTYDAYGASNAVITWSRGLVRETALRYLRPGDAILEVNAGTGADAAWFVERGFRVHATDIAGGMLDAIRVKAAASAAPERFTVQRCSFTDLDDVTGGPYDLVFSNFGGLNCVPDMRLVTRGLRGVLRPGGHVVAVVMPPVCPWEHLQALRGQWRTATRRLHRDGVLAHLEGAHFRTYYVSPGRAAAAFGSAFRRVELRSFCVLCPPSYMEGFQRRFPRVTRGLMRLDERLAAHWPLNRCGDFYILVMRDERALPPPG